MKIIKLSRREFARAIRTGQGSAFLHVRHYGDEGIEPEILGACLQDLRYDTSVETCRSAWLAQMIDSTRNPKLYRDAIANALENPIKYKPHIGQLANLASEFFERGFGEFKETLLKLRSLDDPEILFELPPVWIDIAGMAGFELAARMLVEKNADEWDYHGLWTCLADCEGQSEAKKLIEKRKNEDESFAQFWSQFGKLFEPNDDKSSRRADTNPWTISKLIEAIKTGLPANTYAREIMGLGRKSTEEEAETVLTIVEQETDTVRVIALLKFFAYRAFPHVPIKLLDQIFTKNPNLRSALRRAFSQVKTPLVREVALTALKSKSKEDLWTGLALLENNYDPTDSEVVLKTLQKFVTPDDRHRASSLARGWCENGHDVRLAEVLIMTYSLNPCSYCRYEALRLLVERKQAPEDLLFQSQWDANLDARLMARGALTESCMARSSNLCKRIEARWKLQI